MQSVESTEGLKSQGSILAATMARLRGASSNRRDSAQTTAAAAPVQPSVKTPLEGHKESPAEVGVLACQSFAACALACTRACTQNLQLNETPLHVRHVHQMIV